MSYRMNGEAVRFKSCERLDASRGALTFQMTPVAVFAVAALPFTSDSAATLQIGTMPPAS